MNDKLILLSNYRIKRVRRAGNFWRWSECGLWGVSRSGYCRRDCGSRASIPDNQERDRS